MKIFKNKLTWIKIIKLTDGKRLFRLYQGNNTYIKLTFGNLLFVLLGFYISGERMSVVDFYNADRKLIESKIKILGFAGWHKIDFIDKLINKYYK